MTEQTNDNSGKGNGRGALAIWGEREEVKEMSDRIRKYMPGGDKLTEAEALILAQYGLALDANVFRGEVYAYKDRRGQLMLVEGYKLLVRWAKRQGGYIEKYEPLDVPEGDIGFRCFILRKDDLQTLSALKDAGADFATAFALAATFGDGVVRHDEMIFTRGDRRGKPIAPPQGWTWEQVGRKRALKMALRFAFGAPSPSEIAQETWMVGDTQTASEDWTVEVDPDMTLPEREATAQLSAATRAGLEEFARLSEDEQQALLYQGCEILRGSAEDAEGI